MDRIERCCEKDRKVAAEILEYLANNPNSKDTLEGIAEWWLLKNYVETGVEAVARGLAYLCSLGYVHEDPCNGNEPIYRLNLLRYEKENR